MLDSKSGPNEANLASDGNIDKKKAEGDVLFPKSESGVNSTTEENLETEPIIITS